MTRIRVTLFGALCALLMLQSIPSRSNPTQDDQAIALRVSNMLTRVPLIDGHNDLPGRFVIALAAILAVQT